MAIETFGKSDRTENLYLLIIVHFRWLNDEISTSDHNLSQSCAKRVIASISPSLGYYLHSPGAGLAGLNDSITRQTEASRPSITSRSSGRPRIPAWLILLLPLAPPFFFGDISHYIECDSLRSARQPCAMTTYFQGVRPCLSFCLCVILNFRAPDL